MTMKILLAVDGSACALRAVDHLIGHVSWFREVPEIHLLHVQPPIPIGRALAHVGKETLHAHYMEESREELREAQQKLDAVAHFHTTHIHVGQPAEVIAKMAGELSCDLIVMGSHGRSGRRWPGDRFGRCPRPASCAMPGPAGQMSETAGTSRRRIRHCRHDLCGLLGTPGKGAEPAAGHSGQCQSGGRTGACAAGGSGGRNSGDRRGGARRLHRQPRGQGYADAREGTAGGRLPAGNPPLLDRRGVDPAAGRADVPHVRRRASPSRIAALAATGTGDAGPVLDRLAFLRWRVQGACAAVAPTWTCWSRWGPAWPGASRRW